MKYAAVIEYIQDAEAVNAARPAHRAYLSGLLGAGKLAASGPFDDGYGALIVYNADTLEEAERLIEADPFRGAGVFVRWTVRPWKVVFSNPQLMTV